MTQAQWKYEEDTYDITILIEKPYTNIKYSQLKPLIQALSQPGSGRYEIILSTWNKYPDLFKIIVFYLMSLLDWGILILKSLIYVWIF